MGHTLHVKVPDAIYRSLSEQAQAAGQTPEEWVARWLATAAETRTADPLEPFIGVLESAVPDWADQHDEHLGRNVMQELNTAAHGDSSDA